ncbi:MAG: DNA repair protein RecO [Candidatus Cloacimonadales bacterium]|nr:DNA repair protein RecO [Candidatus Cloacimonadales bacterium]
MSEKSRDLNLKGIILKKTPFRETSLILDIFTPDLGSIPVMAKGVRQEKSKTTGLLEILNELDLSLYKNPASDWYIFKSAELLKAHLYETNFRTGILMQGAAEIYKQLLLEYNDYAELYELLQQYLLYIRTIPRNGIAIFWRFLLKLFRLIGIEFSVNLCVECNQENNFVAYYPQRHGFICKNCYRPIFENFVIGLNREQADIFANLRQIGKLLDELIISKQTIDQINRIFLMHLSEHFHQKFFLKSVEMY